MTRDECKPGPGWTAPYQVAVYEHDSGARLHVMGYLRLPDGSEVSAFNWPESSTLARFIRINGGNRKRGAMAWARSKMKGGGA